MNGFHSHLCMTHKSEYRCAKVTHCTEDYKVKKCQFCVIDENELGAKMTKTKVIATLKADDNISITIEIEDNFGAEEDEKRIRKAYRMLLIWDTYMDRFEEFRSQFDFTFE